MANPELSPPLSLARPTGVAVTAGKGVANDAKGKQGEAEDKLKADGQSLKDVTPADLMNTIKKKSGGKKAKW